MTEITRRRLLGTGAIAAGGAVLSSVLPPNLQKAIAAAPKTGSIEDIEHVVVLMQENRSFDHYFGTLAGVRGYGDPDMPTQANGKSLLYQTAPTTTNPDGYLLPWHLDTKSTSAQAIPSTSHAWATQHEALDITVPTTAGQATTAANDNWVPAHLAADGAEKGPFTMSYYERDDVPFQFALAENFTLCDGYHCSLLGPTWPNRMYLMSAFVDPQGQYGGPMTANTVPTNGYTWTTYPERLQAAGVSWQVYQEEDDYGTNVLEFFQQFQQAKPGSGLYERGLTISAPGQFEADAAAGTLPTVSWIVPTSGQSEHPAYLPASGADFVASKLEAVAANQELWNKTLFILNYDENDGLFDHVTPPLPPANTPDEFIQAPNTSDPLWPIGGGVRVPCFLISPWTVGGWVASETFDHTSVLQLLEKVTGVVEENMSQWRRDTFGDLTSALGFSGERNRQAPPLPKTRGRFWQAEYEVETLPQATPPGADQTPPVQATQRSRTAAGAANGNGASAATAGQAAMRTTASRFTESRTSHRSDFPNGLRDSEFPGKLADSVGKAITPGSTYAWVSMVCFGGIAAIDTSSYALTMTAPYETNPYGIAALPDGSKLYVTQSGTNLVNSLTPAQLGGTSEDAGNEITVGVYPHGIAASPDGSRVYVANTGPGFGAGGSATVSIINTATDTVVGAPTVGQSPQIIAVSPDSRRVYVSCLDGVHVLIAASGRAHLLSDAAPQAHGLAVSADGRVLYVADSLRDRLLAVDAHSGRTLGQVKVGSNPWNVALTPDGLSAYVTNSNDDTVSVVDTATRQVTDTVSVSRIPTGITAYNGEMWVTGNVSSTISVIDTQTNQVTQSVALGISAEPTQIAFA